MMNNPVHIADACEAIISIDHYMVGLVVKLTFEEKCQAEQVLIWRQNREETNSEPWKRLDKALNYLGDIKVPI